MFKDLKTEKISYKYSNSRNKAIDSIDFKTSNGRRTALLGENGCGKSTLIYQIGRAHV